MEIKNANTHVFSFFFFKSNLNWVQSPWRSLILCHHNETAAISVPVESVYAHTHAHSLTNAHKLTAHTKSSTLPNHLSSLWSLWSVSLPKSVNVVSWSDMQICTWEKFPLYSVTYHWLEFEMGRKGKYALGRYKNIIAQTYTCSNSTVITPQVMD